MRNKPPNPNKNNKTHNINKLTSKPSHPNKNNKIHNNINKKMTRYNLKD